MQLLRNLLTEILMNRGYKENNYQLKKLLNRQYHVEFIVNIVCTSANFCFYYFSYL